MGTLSSRKIQDALGRAKNIGLVEERVQIEDCEIVLRNLRPDEYESIIAECSELTENQLAYLNTWQRAHVSKAIVEINGLDLRGVEFIEDEEPDPKRPGQVRTVKLETAAYLRKNVVATWAKEALFVAYRKFGDVVNEAEKKAKDKVTFLVAEEPAIDKLRRLMGEVRELEDEIPASLVDATLAEFGYQHKLTVERASSMEERLSAASSNETAEPTQQPQETDGTAPPLDLARMMRERVPMNQTAVSVPVPPPAEAVPAPMHAPAPVYHAPPAQPQPMPANALHGVPVHVMPGQAPGGHGVPVHGAIPQTGRGALYASLETGVDPTLTAALLEGSSQAALAPQSMQEIPTISGQGSDRIDPAELKKALDQPPKVGLNPLFRPPQRLP